MNRTLFAWLYLLSVISSLSLSASDSTICYLRDADGRIREHNIDFLKMVLDVKFNTKQGKVFGKVKYDFTPIQYITDTVFLNAPGIDIKKVLVSGKETQFTTDSNGITIRFLPPLDWNKQYNMEITYEATPRKGLYFVGWNANTGNTHNDPYFTRKQIWTQGQGIDNRHWFPCYDDVNDKLITETIITFDSAYTVIANGVLKLKKANADGTNTWHYAMSKPMVPYLVMIAIDRFAYKDYKSKNGMVSRQYYYNDRPYVVEPTYRYSAEMMDWLSTELQVKYPWETYCNVPVQDFMYGAMENTTATIFGDFYQTDERSSIERSYVATNAHELTHQWFGDYITEYSAQHHWLHESFATYYAKQFTRQVFGEDYYESNKRDEANSAINADAVDRYPVAHAKGGSARHYPKGSFVIDMIRYTVGDSVYRKCITNYLKKHAYANVSNHDFMMAFMETAGINLDWFFDQWLYRAGVPNYLVSYERQQDRVAFYIRQTHQTDELTGYFKMPVVLEVHFADGSSSVKREWIGNQFDTVYVNAPVGKQVSYTLFDPGSNILKTISFSKSLNELKAQATNAKHMIDRYDAICEMRATETELKRDFLISLFNRGDYNRVLIEIISQLAYDRTPAAIQLFRDALKHPDFQVRRAVVEKLNEFPEAILPDVENLLADSSYITIETVLRKLCRRYESKAADYLNRVKNIKGLNNNVRIAYIELLEKGKAATKEQIAELVGYTSNNYEFRTRGKAFEAVQRLQLCTPEIISNLFNAALYTNSRLSGPAVSALKSLLSSSANKEMAKGIFELTPWQQWEKEALEKIIQ
ncbi:MAG: M1 family metallopeptidase [Chitinophagales bacterium]|nr:M1 family metallopeptidase [Chitinophagales bacterium]